ncbi:hypothetical protein BKA65DRAFT_578101 [Rhexocercosporidium sp. MPI-PUGE-AT-0058]|nr:hypothetical protein BKA65DRAFT_578101 [Rhexocercosporidium sp. MPI-PUGE-AT-0058]
MSSSDPAKPFVFPMFAVPFPICTGTRYLSRHVSQSRNTKAPCNSNAHPKYQNTIFITHPTHSSLADLTLDPSPEVSLLLVSLASPDPCVLEFNPTCPSSTLPIRLHPGLTPLKQLRLRPPSMLSLQTFHSKALKTSCSFLLHNLRPCLLRAVGASHSFWSSFSQDSMRRRCLSSLLFLPHVKVFVRPRREGCFVRG